MTDVMRCVPCDRMIAPGLARRITAGSTEMFTCPTCQGALVSERSRIVRPFALQLIDELRYPFNPVTATILLGVLVVTGFVSYAPGGLWLSLGLRCAFLSTILRTAAMGREDAEIDVAGADTSLFAWAAPAFRIIATLVVAYLPSMVASFVFRESTPLIPAALAVVGTIYLPAALIVVAHDKSWLGLVNPVRPIRIIAAIPGAYALTCVFLLVLFSIAWGGVAVAQAIGGILGGALASVFGFLPLVIGARMLGTLVHEHEEELG